MTQLLPPLSTLNPWYLTRTELGLPDELDLPQMSECNGCSVPVVIRKESDPHWCVPCLARHHRRFEAVAARAKQIGTDTCFGRHLRHPQRAYITAPWSWE